MANVHFGNIGDVWKHLPLSEILSIEKPLHYWESHAGSASYPLTHSEERDYGVYHFAAHSAAWPVLARSPYLQLLTVGETADAVSAYPGSPLIAMTVLRELATDYLFCDVDGDSLRDIRLRAKQMGIPSVRVITCAAEGIRTVFGEASRLKADDCSRVFLFIDPYEPFGRSEAGMDSVQLFCVAAEKGIKVMLWYAYHSHSERATLIARIREAARGRATTQRAPMSFWSGNVSLAAIEDPTFAEKVGILGCGIVCSNMSDQSISVCQSLGEALSEVYAGTRFPSGRSGALQFNSITISCPAQHRAIAANGGRGLRATHTERHISVTMEESDSPEGKVPL